MTLVLSSLILIVQVKPTNRPLEGRLCGREHY
jgi:hypothetical protein